MIVTMSASTGPATERTFRLIRSDQAPLLARPFYARGDPGPIVAALAHVPEILELAVPFISAVLGPSAIDGRRKEIVILRSSARAGCRFCIQAHSVVALDSGLSADEVRALRGSLAIDEVFADRAERQLIGWVDTVAALGPVEPRARAEMYQMAADHELMELTLLVGATLMLNRFCTALDLPTPDDVASRLTEVGIG